MGERAGSAGGAGGGEVGPGSTVSGPSCAASCQTRDAKVIVVEHRDRLARFGVEHLEAALSRRAAGSWSLTLVRRPMISCAT